MSAELLMLIGGTSAFVLTIYWVRSRDLREKYALVWILVSFLLFVCGMFPRVIMFMAEESRLSYPAAVLFVALAAVYLFSFTVSVSLSRHFRRHIRLLQEISFLELRIRELERAREAGTVGQQSEPRGPA
jgi:hypothetical protein